MEVVIVYKGALACYEIGKVRADVYNAYLKRYGGMDPIDKSITLVRGLRHWTGSIENDELLFELGKAIDRHHRLDPLFPQKGEDNTRRNNPI